MKKLLFLLFTLAITVSSYAQSNIVYCGIYDFHLDKNPARLSVGNAQVPIVANAVEVLTFGPLHTRSVTSTRHVELARVNRNRNAVSPNLYTFDSFVHLIPIYREKALTEVLTVPTSFCRQDPGVITFNDQGQKVIRFMRKLGDVPYRNIENQISGINTSFDSYRDAIVTAQESFREYSESVDAAMASVTDKVLSFTMSDSDKQAIRDYINKMIKEEMEELITREVNRRLEESKNEN